MKGIVIDVPTWMNLENMLMKEASHKRLHTHDFIHMKYPEQAIYRESILACTDTSVYMHGGRKIVTEGHGVSF